MDILGVGPLEFVFIVILMLLVLGPRGMVKAVSDIGAFLKNMVQSPIWKAIINSSQEIRDVQTQIIKESGLDESLKEIRASTKSINQMTTNIIRPAMDAAKVAPVSLNVPKNADTTSTAAKPADSTPVTTAVVEPSAFDPLPAADEGSALPEQEQVTPAETNPATE